MSDRLFRCHDLLLLIAEQLSPTIHPYEERSYADLLSFCLVSKHCLGAGRRELYREILLPAENRDAAWLFVRALDNLDQAVAVGVRVVEWCGYRSGPRLLASVQAACPGITSLTLDSLQFLDYCEGECMLAPAEIRIRSFEHDGLQVDFPPFDSKMARFLTRIEDITFQSIALEWIGAYSQPQSKPDAVVETLHFISCELSEGIIAGMMDGWRCRVTCIVLEDVDLRWRESMETDPDDHQSRLWQSLLVLMKDTLEILRIVQCPGIDTGFSFSALTCLKRLSVRHAYGSGGGPAPEDIPPNLLQLRIRYSALANIRLLEALQNPGYLQSLQSFPDIRVRYIREGGFGIDKQQIVTVARRTVIALESRGLVRPPSKSNALDMDVWYDLPPKVKTNMFGT